MDNFYNYNFFGVTEPVMCMELLIQVMIYTWSWCFLCSQLCHH